MVGPVRSGAMPPLADGFSARPETAADLGAALVAGAGVALVPDPVAGDEPGGWRESCGKTQLAVSIAESLWESRRVEVLLWVAATGRASVLSAYAQAAADVMGAGRGDEGESAAARFVTWLGRTSRPWLVILDDLRDVTELAGLWPAGPAGRVLITTAQPAAFFRERGTLVHRVGVFSPDEALDYLTGRLTADQEKQRGAGELVHDLGYEPLALAQAAAVIASSALSCHDYRDYFARRRHAAPGGSPPAASVTCAISAEHADRLPPGGSAGAALALTALLDGHGIPSLVLTAPAACSYLAAADGGSQPDGEHVRAQLLAAERAGLLSLDPGGAGALVRMNSVVQAAFRAALPAGTLPQAAAAAAGALLEVWPEDERPGSLAAALRSCAASLQQAAGDALWADGCHPLLVRAGRSLDRAGLTGPAVAYWRELAAVSDRILGRGHPDTLAAGGRLADAYLAAGRAAEAVSCFQWVLAERVRVLGPDHPSALGARLDLGRALVAAGQSGDAVSALDRVAGDYERVFGADHPGTLGARDELAAAYQAAGRSADAVRLYRQTLASRERSQGPDHPATMATRAQLAGAYLADGKLKRALAQYKRVLADSGRILGADHPGTIAASARLASAYRTAGRMASAIQLYEQTRAGYERVLGADHPETLAVSASLARTYNAVGRVTDATTLLRDTLARAGQVLPPGDPLTETVRESLADLTGE